MHGGIDLGGANGLGQVALDEDDFFQFLGRQLRTIALGERSLASWRCLIRVVSTCISSFSSSGARLSISLFLSAVLTMRRVERRSSCRAFIDATISF